MAVWSKLGRAGGPDRKGHLRTRFQKMHSHQRQPDCRARAEWGQPPLFFYTVKEVGLWEKRRLPTSVDGVKLGRFQTHSKCPTISFFLLTFTSTDAFPPKTGLGFRR